MIAQVHLADVSMYCQPNFLQQIIFIDGALQVRRNRPAQEIKHLFIPVLHEGIELCALRFAAVHFFLVVARARRLDYVY